jgi:hypothetical protein
MRTSSRPPRVRETPLPVLECRRKGEVGSIGLGPWTAPPPEGPPQLGWEDTCWTIYGRSMCMVLRALKVDQRVGDSQ